jgi:hypothetical protein
MRSPVRNLPPPIEAWTSRVRRLRWLEGAATALVLWLILALVSPGVPPIAWALVALIVVILGASVQPLRRRWRPISALVGLSISRELRPGDRAWVVMSAHAEPVIVTARRGLRLVVARPDDGPSEGLEFRRTRVFIVPSRRD